MSTSARVAGVLAIVAAAFAADQLTKAWALSFLGATRAIELGLGVTFRLVFNPGAAFGIGGNAGAPLVIGIMILTTALLAWVIVRAVKGRTSLAATLFLAIAAGGAIGNIWDRITRSTDAPLTGKVVDFIAVDWFAIFNTADIFTTLGLAGWAVLLLTSRDKARTTQSGSEDGDANTTTEPHHSPA
ncbi:signal peptidase II [Agreia sp. COWG]|uniref:signal peptidase II n=1 Tax=Agreia sp. COWG TaxID=2773266 RepID=UPI001926C5FC|nr:signal peptidase II [Agreia sp. COWG]CAD6005413.1 Lipoprotein signal peptidase [Agreia sp. COWG]